MYIDNVFYLIKGYHLIITHGEKGTINEQNNNKIS